MGTAAAAAHPASMHADVQPVLFALAVLAAHLCAYSMLNGRSSPPALFTISLVLAAGALRPSGPLAAMCSGLAVFATVFYALDHVHGDCYYSVLLGQTQPRPGIQTDLHYYRNCQQPAQAWWIMLVLSVVWSAIAAAHLLQEYRHRNRRIRLEDDEDGADLRTRSRSSSEEHEINYGVAPLPAKILSSRA